MSYASTLEHPGHVSVAKAAGEQCKMTNEKLRARMTLFSFLQEICVRDKYQGYSSDCAVVTRLCVGCP